MLVTQSVPTAAGNSMDTLRVAQMNLWNLFDTVDDPNTDDMVLTPEEYEIKLHKIANGIKNLGLPDLISVNEAENGTVLKDLAAHDLIKAAGYQVALGPSNDGRGINVGILYKPDRLEEVKMEQPNPTMSFPDRGRGQLDPTKLYARPPLVVDFKVRGVEQSTEGSNLLTVAVNHFKSKLGGAIPEMRRSMQGQYLGEWLDARAKTNPTGATLVVGDLNAFYGDAAYEKLANRADGSLRFYDAPRLLEDDDRYSFIYRGQKNLLDHLMVPAGKEDAIKSINIPHINSDPKLRKATKDDKSRLEGYSDHDPIVVDLDLNRLLR